MERSDHPYVRITNQPTPRGIRLLRSFSSAQRRASRAEEGSLPFSHQFVCNAKELNSYLIFTIPPEIVFRFDLAKSRLPISSEIRQLFICGRHRV